MHLRVVLFFISFIICSSLAAQNDWEVPQEYQYDNHPAKVAKAKRSKSKEKDKLKCDVKYLDGAVPVNKNGIVEWQKTMQLPGLNASEIYDKAYATLKFYVGNHNPFKESRIALINREQKSIIATVRDWLVFKSSALALDRTKISFAIVVNCSDGMATVSITRIGYEYEEDRHTGFKLSAEELITDEKCLNKKHTNVSRMNGKFRIKTIDLKNDFFNWFERELKK